MADDSFPVLISKNDDLNSAVNPLHVVVENALEVVTNVHDYKTANLGGGASDDHDYVVAGSFLRLKGIMVAGSGRAKYEIQVGPAATLVTKAVALLSQVEGSQFVPFDPPIVVPGADTVRVVRTNLQNQPNDAYSTIIGEDVA